MWIPLRPSGQLWTNQKAVPGARAQVEYQTKFHTLPAVVTSSVYLPKFFRQTRPPQSRDMSTWYILLILGAIMLSFNEEKFVKQRKWSMCSKQYSHH